MLYYVAELFVKGFVRHTLWTDVVLVACNAKGSFERKKAMSLKDLKEKVNCVVWTALHRIAVTIWVVRLG